MLWRYRPWSGRLRPTNPVVTDTATNTESRHIMADNKQTKSTAPAFDFAALKPAVAEVPKQDRAAGPNPFEGFLSESYAEWTQDHAKGGRKVTVPAAQATQARNLIRRAADSLGIGSRVVLTDAKGKTIGKDDKMPTTGDVTVLYCGRDRKTRKTADSASA